MLIAVDFQLLQYGASGGVVQWQSGILAAYARMFTEDQLVVFAADDFPPTVLPDLPSLQLVRGAREKLHEQEVDFLRANEGEILLRSYPHFLHPDFPIERQITFIPDMQHVDRPEFFTPDFLRFRRLGFGHLLAKGGAIATMTEFSRQTILRNPWTECHDVFLAPPSVLASEESGKASTPSWLDDLYRFRRFFFFPANPWPHKNHRRLLEAFARAMRRLPTGTGLVLTGSAPHDSLDGLGDLPVLYLGYVDHIHLKILYQRATALSFFSLYEGFGMPLLEAFHHGTPVICSDIPALKEVGGDAVLTCSPTDIDGMADLMVRVAGDVALGRELVTKGKARLVHYDWSTSAIAVREATRRVAERAAAGPPRLASRPSPAIALIVDVASARGSLPNCLGAIRAQTYPYFSALVVTASNHIVDSITEADARIRLAPPGSLAARIADSAGEITLIIRPDCRLHPEALQSIADHFTAHRDCDMLVCATVASSPTGAVFKWSMAVPPEEHRYRDPFQTATFKFLPEFLTQLSIDPRYPRPLVAWRKRIAAFIPPTKEASLAVDFEYALDLVEAGAAVDVLTEPVASIATTYDAVDARYWASVMEGVNSLLLQRQWKPTAKFTRTLRQRAEGREPARGLALATATPSQHALRRVALWLRRTGISPRRRHP
jgi:glycosyltransferase involved in cell wall biosynthesis